MPRFSARRSSELAVVLIGSLIGSAIALDGCVLPPSLVRPRQSAISPLPPTPAQIVPRSTDARLSVITGDINGIRYELRGARSVTVNQVNQDLHLQAGSTDIVIEQQRLYLNGRDRGAISAPATILLDEQGRLFVNGELRS